MSGALATRHLAGAALRAAKTPREASIFVVLSASEEGVEGALRLLRRWRSGCGCRVVVAGGGSERGDDYSAKVTPWWCAVMNSKPVCCFPVSYTHAAKPRRQARNSCPQHTASACKNSCCQGQGEEGRGERTRPTLFRQGTALQPLLPILLPGSAHSQPRHQLQRRCPPPPAPAPPPGLRQAVPMLAHALLCRSSNHHMPPSPIKHASPPMVHSLSPSPLPPPIQRLLTSPLSPPSRHHRRAKTTNP